jgi:hypothetical protein
MSRWIGLVFVLAALAAPPTASSHVGSWHWPVAYCKHRLVTDTMDYRGGFLDITAARCFGLGRPTYFDVNPGVKQYKRFDVFFRSAAGDWRCGELHVAGRRNWHMEFIVLYGKAWCQ